jgi:hypothetical protein
MKTVRDACKLQPNALTIKLSDQIEQLDELINAEGDGAAFFERTFITQGMQDLITEGNARLAGVSSQAIFHLKQAMGGGKTHLLLGFGLLAKHSKLRKKHCSGDTNAQMFESARIAAFNGRNSPTHFFWGEIAQQLGKADMFQEFWSAGPKAPDEKAWLRLFTGDEPILILLDELPPYFEDLATRPVGAGTVADIATRAFANLLTAASKKANVCVVISDLFAAYQTGGGLIKHALDNAQKELGRAERNITPVDLAANEIYEILRKRLFKSLPSQAEIDDVAEAYGKKLEEASKAKVASRGAEAIADEIVATYPFHPRLKNVIALFKENEQFKQTRGLIEIVSRLLRSVWERKANDVFLIGPQHFDLSIAEVRDKLAEISGMRDVVAKDLWDAHESAHAQVIDLTSGKEAASQVGALLLTASLSTAVNAVKGLTTAEMVECLVSPLRDPSDFLEAFAQLESSAWYIHHTPEGRYYFDRQENLTKLLQSLAKDAEGSPQVDDLIRHRLRDMFKATRKSAYDEVLPLPKLEDVADKVRKSRVLLIVSPDSKIPPEEVQKFFDGLSQKNNLCVLTGDKSTMGSVETSACHFYAAQKADSRIPKGHPQREELEGKQQAYEQDFNATILSLFDKVLFPIQRSGKPCQLASKPLEQTRDADKPFSGEEQVEKTLTSNPLKLYLDVEKDFDAIRDKAQDLLWPEKQDEARWSDIADRYAEQAGMPWLPPKGLDTLKSIACNRGLWEDLGNGYVTKKPKKKVTSVQIVAESEPDDEGKVRLRVNPQNAGPAPRIHYAEDAAVTTKSSQLKDQFLTTKALRVNFLVVDPSNQYETGAAVVWSNKLVLRNNFKENGKRTVELLVAPSGKISYTLDGSEPREGTPYTKPVEIGDGDVLLRVFAVASGLEDKKDFRFPAKGKKGVQIDPVKPARLVSRTGRKLDSRNKTFEGLKLATEKSITFENVMVNVGTGSRAAMFTVGEIPIGADFIEAILKTTLEKFAPDAPVTLTFRKAHLNSGHDLKEFAEKLGIELTSGDIEQ